MEKVSIQKPKRPFGDTRRTVILREFVLLRSLIMVKEARRGGREGREGEMERGGGKGSLSHALSLSHTHAPSGGELR